MRIRPYIDTDEGAVVELWGEVFPDSPVWNDPRTDINRKLAVQRDLFLVATVDSRLVGTVMAGYGGAPTRPDRLPEGESSGPGLQ